LDKKKLKAEIERVETALKDGSGKLIDKELKQYLKLLKRELKEKE
jgi:hypothetical protein